MKEQGKNPPDLTNEEEKINTQLEWGIIKEMMFLCTGTFRALKEVFVLGMRILLLPLFGGGGGFGGKTYFYPISSIFSVK